MYNEEIYLLRTTNVLSNETVTEKVTERKANARVESVKRTEYYAAKSAGFNPEVTFVMADYMDYDREPIIKWNDRKFKVTRTYRALDNNELEIVCEGVTDDVAV